MGTKADAKKTGPQAVPDADQLPIEKLTQKELLALGEDICVSEQKIKKLREQKRKSNTRYNTQIQKEQKFIAQAVTQFREQRAAHEAP